MTMIDHHRMRIAYATLKLHRFGAMISGGPDHREAVRVLRSLGVVDSKIRFHLELAGHDEYDIEEFMG